MFTVFKDRSKYLYQNVKRMAGIARCLLITVACLVCMTNVIEAAPFNYMLSQFLRIQDKSATEKVPAETFGSNEHVT